ncbi:MAG TPA: YdeI/OmpD-associated family protein [Terracidiphilus sp.]|nr:YdeI/OmpD-associated family protein [Terracidiphilus sp.]
MSPSTAKSFTAVLEPLQNGLGWVVARVPFDIGKAWPERRGNRVRGEIDGFPFRTSLMAYAGGAGHFLLVNRKMQAAAKAGVGQKVRIRLEPDLEERPAVVPPELAQALKGDRQLRKWFDGLNYYMRRVIGALVSEAKAGESRVQRAERIAEWLLLTMEGEIDPKDPPPILKAAFQRQPLARAGWEAMTPARRRNHLLGIFHYQGAEARERRAAQAVEDAVRVARRVKKGDG